MAEVNWTPSKLADVRDETVYAQGKYPIKVKMDSTGWYFIATDIHPGTLIATGLDVWSACRFLNDRQAMVSVVDPHDRRTDA